MNWRRTIGLLLIGAGLLVLTLKLARVYDPAPAVERLSTRAGPRVAQVIQRLKPEWVALGGLVIVPVLVGMLLVFGSSEAKEKKDPPAPIAAVPSKVTAKQLQQKSAKVVIDSCNVLQTGPDARHLWQFDARNNRFALIRAQTTPAGEPLPAKAVSKDWRSLFQHKLNIAWLPPEHVFLRVAQFPKSEFNETLAMVELQLEKLSPMPVAQIAWSVQVLPQTVGDLQTVIVIIVARNVVEEFLGQLEGQNYLADRLELPILDQLQATTITQDGAWIYPGGPGGLNTALVAWWYGGVLQQLDLVHLPPANRPASLKEQLMQMAWAGELEGWLAAPPRWHLVADASTAGEWEPALSEGLEQPIELIPPLAAAELAALTARRSSHAPQNGNLLPAEFSTRYQQQFIDRLWMRGLLAVGALYIAGVVIYLIGLQFMLFKTRSAEGDVAERGPSYTNAIQLKARYQVLKDRQELKYAALNCWNVTAKLMPVSLTLETMNFSDGRRLTLSGTAPSEGVRELNSFEGAMRKWTDADGQQLFDPLKGENMIYRANGPGSATVSWNFTLELKRAEVQ